MKNIGKKGMVYMSKEDLLRLLKKNWKDRRTILSENYLFGNGPKKRKRISGLKLPIIEGEETIEGRQGESMKN